MTSSDEDFENADRYSDRALELLKKVGFYSVSPSELGQFRYDVRPELKGDKIEDCLRFLSGRDILKSSDHY